MKRRVLFLDRDGVININHGHVHKRENFDFIPGIFALVQKANEADYLVVIVTNQAGIGRGYYSEDEFHVLMEWVKGEFLNRGARVDAVYYSPFHPQHGHGKYKKDSDCRKPKPGMLLNAARDFNIDLPNSILIGDQLTDLEAGYSAGVGRCILIHNNKLPKIVF